MLKQEFRRFSFVICDDDPKILVLLEKAVRTYMKDIHFTDYEIVTFASSEEMDAAEATADIAFLDIRTGEGLNGLTAGRALRRRCPEVILIVVTGFNEYLDAAMDCGVYRYVMKPIDLRRFRRVMRDAVQQLMNKTRLIHFETTEGGTLLYSNEILCVEAYKGGVLLHTIRGDEHARNTFQDCKLMLVEAGFVQTHRSFLVNLSYVRQYDHNSVTLSVHGEDISGNREKTMVAYMTYRRYYQSFKRALLIYTGVEND